MRIIAEKPGFKIVALERDEFIDDASKDRIHAIIDTECKERDRTRAQYRAESDERLKKELRRLRSPLGRFVRFFIDKRFRHHVLTHI